MKNLDFGRFSEFDIDTNIAIWNGYTKNGFEYISGVYAVYKRKIPDLINRLKECGCEIIDQRAHLGKVWCISAQGIVAIKISSNQLFVQATDINAGEKIIAEIKEFLDPIVSDNNVSVNYYTRGPHGVNSRPVYLSKENNEKILPFLYSDIDIAKLHEDYMKAKESLLFLVGKPGVGKTSFLRYVLCQSKIENQDSSWNSSDNEFKRLFEGDGVAYVKDTQVMVESQFWADLTSAKHQLVILDDLDFALATRNGSDNILVSNLLAFSDGLFGSNTKVIITTNTQVTDIDEALLRPGRCFDFLTLNPLSREAALDIWINRLKMTEENFKLKWPRKKEIAQSDLMSFYYRITSKKRDREYVLKGPKVYDIDEKVHALLNKKQGSVGF